MDPRHRDDFFTTDTCSRCSKTPLTIRILSWFNRDTLCMDCSAKEDGLKAKMRQAGMDPDAYEGCGYLPTVPNKEAK